MLQLLCMLKSSCFESKSLGSGSREVYLFLYADPDGVGRCNNPGGPERLWITPNPVDH